MLSMLGLKPDSLGPYALIPGPKERSDLLLEFDRYHASGPWRTLAQGFAERARARVTLRPHAAVE